MVNAGKDVKIVYINKFIKHIIFSLIYLTAIQSAAALPGKSGPWKIGVLYWSMNIPGQVAMRKGLEDKFRKVNAERLARGLPAVILITRVAGDGEQGMEQQIIQMRDLIRLKTDLIIVQPTDNAALSKPLLEANHAGIPVVAYDQYISEGHLTSYITSDNYSAGYLDGEYIASKFDDNRNIKVVLVEYPHVSSTVERVNGFLDGLSENKQTYTIVGNYRAVEPVKGKSAGQAILRKFPAKGSLDVVFTVNDGGGLAVVDELAKAGRREILVATIDGDPVSVQNIRSGRLTAIDSAQFCGPMGAAAFSTAMSVLEGKSVPIQILIPAFPVTKETLSIYPGWAGPIPANFKKLWKSKNPVWSGELKQIPRAGP
jgi:ribose transport system substrate-binding protein